MKKTVLILLVLYGICLTLVSYYVFGGGGKPAVSQKTVIKDIAKKDAGLELKEDGSVVFTPPNSKVTVIQISLVLPFQENLKNIKGSLVLPGLTPIYNKTKLDKTNNKITIDLAGYSFDGILLTSPVVIAKVDKTANLKFDRENTMITVPGSALPLSISYTD